MASKYTDHVRKVEMSPARTYYAGTVSVHAPVDHVVVHTIETHWGYVVVRTVVKGTESFTTFELILRGMHYSRTTEHRIPHNGLTRIARRWAGECALESRVRLE